MLENNDGAKVCAEEHGDNCNDGSAGCINNEINNSAEGDGNHPSTRFANTHNKGEDSGPKVVVTVDADESDEGAALPAVLPRTSPLFGASNIAAGTALHLPAVLPPTHLLLRTCDITAGIALHLPAVLPSTSLLLKTSDIV
ncbi:unnamed protein product, partial [Prunus brigantina]